MVTKFLNVDVDNTLSANSNERVSSQKAIKTYTDNLINSKQNKILDVPIIVESTQQTTVEGALNSINTSLSNKQNQSLSSAILVDGTQQTTVEGTLNALNIYSNSKQDNLVSGTNIKTINHNSILGEGNIDITSSEGAGKSIGEVFYSQSSSAADNPGALPLFTGETISNADELYPDFYQWVADHTGLQISAADYETAISTYGECPKYVIDTTNKTIRLPKLANYVKMANTTDGIAQRRDGLPTSTISKLIGGDSRTTNPITATGMFSVQETGTYPIENDSPDSRARQVTVTLGDTDSVTPAHTTLFPWLVVFNTAVPASTAQAAEFQQALSGKADTNLSNITAVAGTSLNAVGVRTVVETYQNVSSWYRIYSDGWCEQGGRITGTSITFLQSFVDTNYSFSGVSINANSGGAASTVTNLTTTGCTYYTYGNAGGMWQACGYIR